MVSLIDCQATHHCTFATQVARLFTAVQFLKAIKAPSVRITLGPPWLWLTKKRVNQRIGELGSLAANVPKER